MSGYRLTLEADRDIEEIARESIKRWGWERAETYVADLHRAFDLLSTFPELGRNIGHVRPGYRRLERGSHVIFYMRADGGVLIVRLLHRRMESRKHLRARPPQ